MDMTKVLNEEAFPETEVETLLVYSDYLIDQGKEEEAEAIRFLVEKRMWPYQNSWWIDTTPEELNPLKQEFPDNHQLHQIIHACIPVKSLKENDIKINALPSQAEAVEWYLNYYIEHKNNIKR